MNGIDLNRGVSKRTHARTGIQVVMYKDSPGTYYDAKGNQISDELAGQAGFPIADLKKEKEKRDRLKEAKEDIERDYEMPEGESIYSNEQCDVVCVSEPNGTYNVVIADGGEILNEKLLSKNDAVTLAKTFED